MSEFAYFRFMSNKMLTIEEQQHKDEVITLTEQVLDAKGIQCDSKISKISEEQLREILEAVRRLRKRKNKNKKMIEEDDDEEEEEDDQDNRHKEKRGIVTID
jgi:GTPase involved in cell partitioning and DNA repair